MKNKFNTQYAILNTKRIVMILFVILLLLPQAKALAATYYVSPQGAGSHNGSLGNEFNLSEAQTYANSHISEEILFLLADGNYPALSEITNRSTWVTWRGSAEVVFKSINLGQWNLNPNIYFRFEDIVVDSKEKLAANAKAINLYKVNYVEFNKVEVVGNGYELGDGTSGINIFGSTNIQIKNCNIYGIGATPNSAFEKAIYGRVSNNVLIEGCEIQGCSMGIIAWGYNWTMRNNHLHHLNSDGILGTDLADSLIENNLIHDLEKPLGTGYHVDLIQLYNVNPQAGPDTIHMKNIIIRGNVLYRSEGQVVLWNHFHYNPENIVFEKNLIYGARSTAHEFHVSETTGLVLRNNTIIGNTIFRGNKLSVDVLNNVLYLYSPGINEGVVINSEQDNIISRFASWTVPADSSYKLSEDTVILDEKAFNSLFLNTPVFGDTVKYIRNNYDAIIGEALINGKYFTTFKVTGMNFNELGVFPGYGVTVNSGGDAFTCYQSNESKYACYDLFIWKVEGDTITLIKDITNIPGRTVNIGIPYSKSTKTRIYVADNDKYQIGDVIDYDFDEIAHTVINKGTDDFGEYINIDVPLFEEARVSKKMSNWGQGHINVKRDFHPRPDSIICNGSRAGTQQGVAWAGALSCAGSGELVYGDVSGDGEISAFDAALTAQYAVALITLTPDQIKAADVSGNGEVSAYDAALIAQRAVGLGSKEPFINNLASILSAIQNILGKLKSLF